MLQLFLKAHAVKGTAAIVGRRHLDEQGAVGIGLIAGMLAHAVDDHAMRRAGRGNDKAARAHAEGVDAASA